ncbi:MAG: Uma2 family endonuclease [Candidatus Brocadia sp.]|jgi:Uma2 family endonuclease
MSSVSSVKFTYKDYLLFPEGGKKHEIIDGERYMTPAPSIRHQRISGKIFRLLSDFVEKNVLGEVFCAPCDIIFPDTDVVQPDIIFISTENKHIIIESNIQGTPDLVIEVTSETTRRTDKVIKRRLYEKFRVKEYWIIDPAIDTVEVYKPTGTGYKKVAEYEKDENFLQNFSEVLSLISIQSYRSKAISSHPLFSW